MLDDEIVTDWRLWLSQSPVVLWSLVVALTATLFVADMISPFGFGGWILYIVVVLLAAQRSEAKYNREVALVTTLLIIAGFFLSQRTNGVPAWLEASNRLVGIFAVWITSFLATQCTKAENRERTGRRLLRTTLMSIGDGVAATDAAGRVTFMNPVAEKLVGGRQRKRRAVRCRKFSISSMKKRAGRWRIRRCAR